MLRNDLSQTIDLNGIWSFRLEVNQSWSTIQTPGCWEAQGYSKWSEGPAFYRRIFEVPAEWSTQRIFLEFDAVSYHCTVLINGATAGVHRGMWTPFAVDVTDYLTLGVNLVELVVFKPGTRYPVRSTLAGFLPDVGVVFGGLWQGVRLRAISVGFSELRLSADPDAGAIHILGKNHVFNSIRPDKVRFRVQFIGKLVAEQELVLDVDNNWDGLISVQDLQLWSPEHPFLYEVSVELLAGDQLLAVASEQTGFRRLSAVHDQLLLNGYPIFLCGVLHWGWDPDRIAPTFSDNQIRRELRMMRELGFNLIKLCLFVPNRRYYEIADEEGMLLWQEWPLWQPEMTCDLREILADEYVAYMQMAAHHPSIVIYSIGCELSEAVDAETLIQLDTIVRRAAPTTLVCDNSGSAEAYGGVELDLADFYDYHTYTDLHFFEPIFDHWRRDWRPPRPWIFGEFNDTDNYRDLNAIIAANGGERPWWITEEIPVHTWRPEVRALLDQLRLIEDANLGFTPQELTAISRAQSLTVIKYVVELVRRRAGMGGYVLLGIRDTPIITSGILDDFGNAKWPAEELRRFNNDAVLCIEVDRRRSWVARGDRPERLDTFNWWSGDVARLHCILHAVGEALTPDAHFEWCLQDSAGETRLSGVCPLPADRWMGRPQQIATITPVLPIVTAPEEFLLIARVGNSVHVVENRWPLWIYPKPRRNLVAYAIYDPSYYLSQWKWNELLETGQHISWEKDEAWPQVVVATALSPRLIDYLHAGGRVFLIQQSDGPLPVRRTSFWRESIKLFYAHPLWLRFPHRNYTDLQFFGLATDVAFETRRIETILPDVRNTRTLLRRLDAREFHITDYVIEAEIGEGRLLASTLCYQGGYGAQPSSLHQNVAGCYLLFETIRYLVESIVA
jgi:hypothetical protein